MNSFEQRATAEAERIVKERDQLAATETQQAFTLLQELVAMLKRETRADVQIALFAASRFLNLPVCFDPAERDPGESWPTDRAAELLKLLIGLLKGVHPTTASRAVRTAAVFLRLQTVGS